MAARWGRWRATEELLRRGADASAVDVTGRTAADVARSRIDVDPEKHRSVHPPPLPATKTTGTHGTANQTKVEEEEEENEEDEEEDEEEARLKRAEQRAKAAADYSLGLTPHERVLAVLEDWEALAAEAREEEEAREEVRQSVRELRLSQSSSWFYFVRRKIYSS
jgi:hypothetical protein